MPVVDCCTGADVIGILLGSMVVKLLVETDVEGAKIVGCRGGCSALQIMK